MIVEIYDRMVVIDEKYSRFTNEQLEYRIQKGRELVGVHGSENLHNILKDEDDFVAVGAYFDFVVASDESNYTEDDESENPFDTGDADPEDVEDYDEDSDPANLFKDGQD